MKTIHLKVESDPKANTVAAAMTDAVLEQNGTIHSSYGFGAGAAFVVIEMPDDAPDLDFSPVHDLLLEEVTDLGQDDTQHAQTGETETAEPAPVAEQPAQSDAPAPLAPSSPDTSDDSAPAKKGGKKASAPAQMETK